MEIRNKPQNLTFGHVLVRGTTIPRIVNDSIDINHLKIHQIMRRHGKHMMILEGTPASEKSFINTLREIAKAFNIRIRKRLPQNFDLKEQAKKEITWFNKKY